jgi:hypothetical protein
MVVGDVAPGLAQDVHAVEPLDQPERHLDPRHHAARGHQPAVADEAHACDYLAKKTVSAENGVRNLSWFAKTVSGTFPVSSTFRIFTAKNGVRNLFLTSPKNLDGRHRAPRRRRRRASLTGPAGGGIGSARIAQADLPLLMV